jgi:hypothetical protein
VTSLSTGARSKPILDEAGFQQLLAAAYVLQRHNDSLRAKDPRLDAAWIFSEIAQIQSEVRKNGLSFSESAGAVAEGLQKITGAAGTSICLMRNGVLDCIATAGISAEVPGGSAVASSLVGSERLKNGREFHSSDAKLDTRLDIATCRSLNIGSLLAVPIQSSGAGEISGVVEVRWSKADGFHECDVRTCELVAGLVTELLEKQATEHNLATGSHTGNNSHSGNTATLIKPPENGSATEDIASVKNSISALANENAEPLATCCRVCGRPFGPDEAFCGKCSMPRVAGTPSENLQSKWASMWFMQQAQETLQEQTPAPVPPRLTAPKNEIRNVEPSRQPWQKQQFAIDAPSAASATPTPTQEQIPTEIVFEHTPLPETQSQSLSLWAHQESSRSSAWNEEISETGSTDALFKIKLSTRRNFDVLKSKIQKSGRTARVALVSGALLLVLAAWSFWPSSGTSSQFSWVESLLVELGLAQVPQGAPVHEAGSPDVRVWVDVHTALYYCPGSDMYGKTPGGHFSTQKAAQEDQFESATRVVCK